MRRRGWTLHEMLISLVLVGGVIALASRLAAGQLRFLHGANELATIRGDAGQASGIAAAMLRGVSPPDGDIVAAQDSAVEFHMTIGSAIACEGMPGVVTVPARSEPDGNALASFAELPGPGDRMLVLAPDSLAWSWTSARVMESVVTGAPCPAMPAVSGTRSVRIDDSVTVHAGTPVRFTRPVRLSLYRGSDGRWYLGARDWNGEAQRFNGIQPVAGPLRSYSVDATRTGLRFTYRDASGTEVSLPEDLVRVAIVGVVARAAGTRFTDSSAATIALGWPR